MLCNIQPHDLTNMNVTLVKVGELNRPGSVWYQNILYEGLEENRFDLWGLQNRLFVEYLTRASHEPVSANKGDAEPVSKVQSF